MFLISFSLWIVFFSFLIKKTEKFTLVLLEQEKRLERLCFYMLLIGYFIL